MISRFRRERGALLALGWIALLIVIAVFAPLLTPHDPIKQDLVHTFDGASRRHWLGTDDLGRDVLSRLAFGARISMRISFEVVVLALLAALPLGLFAGYRGGRVDNVLMRLMDAGMSFPPLILALAVAGVLGGGVNNEALALTLVFIPSFTRLVRSRTLVVREETFIEASQAVGSSPVTIVGRRVLPNVLSAVIVQVALALGGLVVIEAGLAFLGLGAAPPTASWGAMLREAYDTALFTHPWALVVPGAAIALTVFAFNTIGDGLVAAIGGSSSAHRRRRRRRSRGLTRVVRSSAPAAPFDTAVLSLRDLCVDVETPGGPQRVIDGVSLDLRQGRVLGLVGESGCGKTMTSLSVLRLLPSPPFTIVGGSIVFDGRDVLEMRLDQLRRLRGRDIAMVFQDPTTSLNPAMTIGAQLAEAIRLHEDVAKGDARRRARELLDLVGIPDAARRFDAYPHQLSGGMCQRVMIALALSCRPRVLIADEPTTALDVTIQAEILDLLRRLQREQQLSVLFVTHDLGVVADVCDDVAVMYAGQIVETGPTSAVFSQPRHPYTEGLLGATLAVTGEDASLVAISGSVPMLGEIPVGCRFHTRCPYATDACAATTPDLVTGNGVAQRCLRSDELVLRGSP